MSAAPGAVLHVVRGTTGGYEAQEWTVAAYLDRAEAERHRDALQAWAKRAEESLDLYLKGGPEVEDFTTPLDPYEPAYNRNNFVYSVTTLFLHKSIETFVAGEATLNDLCKEKGWKE